MDIPKVPKSRLILIAILLLFLAFLAVVVSLLNFSPISVIKENMVNDSVIGKDVSYLPSRGESIPPEYVSDGGANKSEDQKLIKTGSIRMYTNDFDNTVHDVRNITKNNNGLVTNSSDSGDKTDRRVTITVKVPADKFDVVMSEIKKTGVEVISSSENSSDVTQTYMDLEARLKTSMELEQTLVSILGKATKVSEIIEIQRELSSVRQTIESLTSQIRYYDSQIDMSTITVSLELSSESLDVTGTMWKPLGVFKEALQALVEILKSFGTLAIWTLVFSPIVLVPYGVYRVVTVKRK